MNRCWHALNEQYRLLNPEDLRIECPLELMSVEQKGLGRMARAWKRSVEYPLLVRKGPVTNVYHVLDHSFADLIRWVPKGAKTVVTVHDIIPLLESDGLSPSQQRRFRRRVANIERADRVVCVSEFTRTLLLKAFRLDGSRVLVIPNGATTPVRMERATRNPFPTKPGIKLLLVGSVLRRKNLRLVPGIVRELRNRGVEVVLLRIGQMLPPELASEIHQALSDSERLVELGLVSDSVLQAAYQFADALIFPSTNEGFGLPVLEAMAEGCPVITSNAASLPEVGGDAVLYFDPGDAAQAAEACVRLMSEPGLRESLKNRGLERSAQFTWERHWDELCEVYRELTTA